MPPVKLGDKIYADKSIFKGVDPICFWKKKITKLFPPTSCGGITHVALRTIVFFILKKFFQTWVYWKRTSYFCSMKKLSRKLNDHIFLESENYNRDILRDQLVKESQLVFLSSREILNEYERFIDWKTFVFYLPFSSPILTSLTLQ